MNRGAFVAMGKETVDRVIERLLTLTPENKGRPQIGNFFSMKQHIQKQPGTNYLPDLEHFINGHYGLEIKGITVSWLRNSDKFSRAGRLKLLKDQWTCLVEWCKREHAEPRLVIELKTLSQTAPYLYFQLGPSAIKQLFDRTGKDALWINASIWDLIDLGEKL